MEMTSACHRSVLMALMTGTILAGMPVSAATLNWLNPAEGDWFEGKNWTDDAVPTAGDDAAVNNGGTAEAAGPVTPTAGRLAVGAGAGNVSGTVTTGNGTDLALGLGFRNLNVGVAGAADADARGTVSVGGSITGIVPATAIGEFGIGLANGDNAQAEGTVSVAGDMTAIFGSVGFLGEGSNQTATGALTVGGSLIGLRSVGVSLLAENGSVDGAVTVTGGDLTPSDNFFVVGQALRPGSVASGSVDVQTGHIRTTASQWSIGTATQGGKAAGSVSAAGVDATGAALFGLSVGTAGDGSADGMLALGAGELRVGGSAFIGTASVTAGATARGDVTLDGALVAQGVGHLLAVGQANGQVFQSGPGTATGALSAEGASGFRFVLVGVANGSEGLGLEATGALTVGMGGLTNTVDPGGTLQIGLARALAVNNQVKGPGPVAEGSATVTGAVEGYNPVIVGRVENGGTATGTLVLDGGSLTATILDIGSVQRPNESVAMTGAVTASAKGRVEVTDGEIVLSNPDPSFGGLTLLGNVEFGGQEIGQVAEGTLALTRSRFESAAVVMARGEGASGTLSAIDSEIAVGAMAVGTAGAVRDGSGRVILTDSTLTATADPDRFLNGSVSLNGGDTSLTASGSDIAIDGNLLVQFDSSAFDGDTAVMAMTGGTLAVGGTVAVGDFRPGSRGEIGLTGTQATVGGDLLVGRSANAGALFGDALLHLGGSLMDVSGSLLLDLGGELSFGVGGLGRGLGGYGALDLALADLRGGQATVDFAGLTGPLGFESADFDLISVLSGFTGDFGLVSILNLPVGYSASHGFFIEGEGDVWRVTLTREVAVIPLPAGAWLLLSALAGLALMRRLRAG